MSLVRDGFARLDALLTADQVARLGAGVDALLAQAPAREHGAIVHQAWRRVPALADELATGRLAEVARGLLGVDAIVLFQDHVIAKPPGTTAPILWHQDYAYWPLDAPAGLTMWVALDDADEDNGCLRYLAGTHLRGERRASSFAPGGGRHGGALPAIDAGDDDGVATPVRAGDALVHHPLTWHASPPNRSTRPRRAWSLSWIAPTVTWAPGHAPHPFTALRAPAAGAPVEGPAFLRF
jgi:ectoine hydroxylase-related dioxygenase (phytanoyl-CoA dioxygenase family)